MPLIVASNFPENPNTVHQGCRSAHDLRQNKIDSKQTMIQNKRENTKLKEFLVDMSVPVQPSCNVTVYVDCLEGLRNNICRAVQR